MLRQRMDTERAIRGSGASRGDQRYNSSATSDLGWLQQINARPSSGGSSGSGEYTTSPSTSPHSQVWQTPVRQDHAAGTSQASASSSRLPKLGSQRTVRPEVLNETSGPVPGSPGGGWGGCCAPSSGSEPKI